MISPDDLLKLLSDLESDCVERTTSVSDTDKFSQAVCAFANDFPGKNQPGYLIVGADDHGQIKQLSVTDQLLQNLGSLRSNGNILPQPAITVEKFSFPEGDLAVVEVRPSDLPPVRYKGRVWIRIGPRKATANEQEEQILSEKRLSSARSFDATPVAEASIRDMSLPLFASYRQTVVAADVIEANHRRIEEQLASLRFFDLRNNAPTVAGLLLFASNPRYFFPGAYVQYLAMPGDDLTQQPVDQAEISGDILSILRELDTRIKTGITTALQRQSILRESLARDYPEISLRELLVNAIMHRDYQSNTPVKLYRFSDHIEIHSPGGLYGEVTAQTLTKRSSYRNPILAEALKTLGYVNKFGYGIQRAQAALQENGNPPAEFEVDDRYFLVKIRRKTA